MTSLKRTDNNDWEYIDPDGDTVRIEWTRGEDGDSGGVLLRVGRYGSALVGADDIDAFINAIHDAANAACPNCEGTGRRKA